MQELLRSATSQNVLYQRVVSSFSLETVGPESVMHSELHLCTLPSKEEEIAGPPVASVLQAFAVLGELRTKLKTFGKAPLAFSVVLCFALKMLFAGPP